MKVSLKIEKVLDENLKGLFIKIIKVKNSIKILSHERPLLIKGKLYLGAFAKKGP